MRADSWSTAPPQDFQSMWLALRDDLAQWGVARDVHTVFVDGPRVGLAQRLLGRDGFPRGVPDALVMNEQEAEAHVRRLVEQRCLVIELRGFGFVADGYLVSIDHAGSCGSRPSRVIATGIRHPLLEPKTAAVPSIMFERIPDPPYALPPCPLA